MVAICRRQLLRVAHFHMDGNAMQNFFESQPNVMQRPPRACYGDPLLVRVTEDETVGVSLPFLFLGVRHATRPALC